MTNTMTHTKYIIDIRSDYGEFDTYKDALYWANWLTKATGIKHHVITA